MSLVVASKSAANMSKVSKLAAPTAIAAPDVLLAGSGTVLTVGIGMEFATLADAVKASVSGDTIAVKAGTYTNDFTTITNSLRIVAVGGMVNEVATVPPPNDKALMTVDANLSIQGFSFTGGGDGSPDGNVSGIRLEAGNLSVKYCYFHDMQEGLLAGPDAGATVTIDHSEFAHNGTGDGYTHNLYVGAVGSLTITNSYFHDANVGHEIKSRAAVTTISHNVIADGPNGTASYDIDIPNAGVATISDNIIEKGAHASNWPAIHYGGEFQYAWTANSLAITGNTIINDYGALGEGVLNQSAQNGLNVSADLTGNKLYGFDPTRLVVGAGTLTNNVTLTSEPGYSTASPWTSVPILSVSTGPELLNLSNGNHTISGGQAHLTVNDTGGSNTINGGAGGITVAATAGWDVISTQAGAHDTLVLPYRSSVVHSAGADSIVASGYYEEVEATGQATIAGGGFNTYDLEGAGEVLHSSSSGYVNVGAAGGASVTDTGGDLALTLAAGGRLAIDDVSGVQSGNAASTATVSGGAATGRISNGGSIILTTGASGAAVLAGTGIVDVTGGAGADTLAAGSGTDSFILGGGADQVVFSTGTANVTGGSGTDTYVFNQGEAGTDTITGFKAGTDVLQFNGFGANLPAIASGAITTGGDTVLTLADGTTIDLVGVALPGYRAASGTPASGGTANPSPTQVAANPLAPVSGNGTLVVATGGHSLAAGASVLAVQDLAGGNTIGGSAAGLAIQAGCYDAVTTQAGAADQVTLQRYDTLTGGGADNVLVSGYANTLNLSAAATIVLAGGGNVVQGGAGLLTVSNQVGGDHILGGAGGLTASLAAQYDTVTTAQGAADTVSLAGQSSLVSAGDDRITIHGLYNQVVATGNADITADLGFSSYVLDGADTLTSAGGGMVTVGGAAQATVAAGGQQDLAITKLAGGVLSVSESLPGGLASLAITGGAATIGAASGTYAGLRATLGAGVSVTAGSGNTTLTGGAGQDSLTGGSGQITITLGAQDTVSLGAGGMTVQGGSADTFIVPPAGAGTLVIANWSAQDSIVTAGQAAPAIASQTVTGGSTWLTMVGGGQVELMGVSHFG